MDRYLTRRTLLWLVFALAVFLGVFQLPFFFPPQHPSSSPSYVAGFNNRVSVGVTLLASLAVLIYFFRRQGEPQSGLLDPRSEGAVPFRDFLWVAAIYVVVLTGISVVADLAPTYLMADARYFVHLVSEMQFFGRRPYADFDYAYGPLMLYGPVWFFRAFAWTGMTLEVADYVVTNVMMLVGLALLFFIVNRLYPAGARSRWLFVILGLGTLYLTLGANGTYVRFLFPFAAIVFLREVERRGSVALLTAYLGGCQWFCAMISPEIGVAFLAASGVYVFARAWVHRSWRSLVLGIGPVLGIGVALLSFGSPFLHSIREFSSGSLNWVVVPYPPLLLYLVVVIAVSPAALAAIWRSGLTERAMFSAYYVCGLVLVSAALGRCDFVHLLFNGTGLIVLAFAHLRGSSRKLQNASLAALAVCAFSFQIMWVVVSRHDLLNPAFDAVSALVPAPMLDRLVSHFGPLARETAKLRKIATRSVTELPDVPPHVPIATPWMLDKRTDEFLGQRGNHQSEFYTDFINVATPEGEQRKIDALSKERWALVPRSPSTWLPSRNVLAVRFLYPLTYPERNAPYPTAQGTLDYLHAHYHRVRDIGDYTLWERN